MGDTCAAQTKFRPSKHDCNHTVRCQLEAGHEGMHQWNRDARTVYWAGPAVPAEDNTRFRFGRWLEER
jgi:hypothetical protein